MAGGHDRPAVEFILLVTMAIRSSCASVSIPCLPIWGYFCRRSAVFVVRFLRKGRAVDYNLRGRETATRPISPPRSPVSTGDTYDFLSWPSVAL